MDEQKVRNYLLEAVRLEKGRSLGGQIRHDYKSSIVVFSISYAVASAVTFIGHDGAIAAIVLFVLMSLSIPMIIIWSIRSTTHSAANWESVEAPGKSQKKNYAMYGLCAWGVALLLSSFIGEISQAINTAIIVTCAWIVISGVVFIACTRLYQHHLLKKYCPDLIDYKPGSF